MKNNAFEEESVMDFFCKNTSHILPYEASLILSIIKTFDYDALVKADMKILEDMANAIETKNSMEVEADYSGLEIDIKASIEYRQNIHSAIKHLLERTKEPSVSEILEEAIGNDDESPDDAPAPIKP